jgi:hypothetical protein
MRRRGSVKSAHAYTADAKRTAAIYSELHANIQDKVNEAGVEPVAL